MRSYPVSVALSLLCTVVLVGCAVSVTPATEPPTQQPSTAPTEPPATSTAQDSASPSTASGAVTDLADVRGATVRIEVEGLLADPEYGATEAAFQGSGFFIDPSGIIVTNNHVVTGSSLRRVYIGGDNTHEYPAIILGASECSDLAVLQIQPPGDFPYLAWREGAVGPGAEQYFAIGYPDNVYRQDPGTVNTDPAAQATQWSDSISVVEISNNIIPGNSGGPLVNAQGEVIGVDYAGIAATNQSFAIAGPEAKRIVDQLRQGTNVEYIGINGLAFADSSSGVSGIYVYGVEPGSKADNAQVKAGDVILTLGGLTLARDGTMADYCSILRSHRETDQVDVEVYSPADGNCYAGQLNNPERQLTQVACPPGLAEVPSTSAPVAGTLVDHAPIGFASTCEPADPYGGATESIRCVPDDSRVTAVYYDQFTSTAAMNAEYDGLLEYGGVSSDTGKGCAKNRPTEAGYIIGGVHAGRYVCFVNSYGNAEIAWTHDSLLIISTAFGPTGNLAKPFDWFLNSDSGPNQ